MPQRRSFRRSPLHAEHAMRRLMTPLVAARRMRGAAMTEFVIVGPVAILLTFVLLQAGMLYMAKLTLNNATFMAARHGATENASPTAIRVALGKGLIPFYQDSTNTNDVGRLTAAAAKAALEVVNPLNVEMDILSPSQEAFNVYGITAGGTTYIPNDNLEFRTAAPINGASISLRDANILRIRVTYGYELKVPLMAAVIKRIMCFGADGSDVTAWDNSNLMPWGDIDDCVRYYLRGRVPIVSFATVQMQSRPQR
ncbi:MAG: pilus assembly protein [Haliea sp.]|nr:MAG: pilus assembly protein [Haliea sp.]